MTAEDRLRLVVRTVNLLRIEIENNGGRYDGRMVPNLTSVTDLCVAPAEFLVGAEAAVAKLEAAHGVVPARAFPGSGDPGDPGLGKPSTVETDGPVGPSEG